jgi:hypothetical protein
MLRKANALAVKKWQKSISRAKRFAEKLNDKIIMPVEDDPWTVKAVAPAPTAAEAVSLVQDVLADQRSMMIFLLASMVLWLLAKAYQKRITSLGRSLDVKTMSGGFLEKCEPVWLEINKDGKWVKQRAEDEQLTIYESRR